MMITNNLRRFLPCLMALVLCLPVKGMAQVANELPDSILYSLEVYKKMYEEYNKGNQAMMLRTCAVVAEVFGKVESADDFTANHFNAGVVNLNTKLADLGADLSSVLDLTEVIKQEFGVVIPEEQAVGLATVEDYFEIVRPRSDTIKLTMAYYPWRTVFDSRSVYRAGVYEDGIKILTDLMKLTTDSIQREIYLDELMDVYDVWYEFADMINKKMEVPISKMQIKCEKASEYIGVYMPIVYGIVRDSIGKNNVMSPFALRAYHLLRDALYEQESVEDLYYTIPLYYFKLSQAQIAYYNEKGDVRIFEEQYTADYDTVDMRLSYLVNSGIGEKEKWNIVSNHLAIQKSYQTTIDDIGLGFAKDWREKEAIYRNQLAEKRENWDSGIEEPDAAFLNRVISQTRNDSSDVYVEALECYVQYIVPKGSVTLDMLDDFKSKRNTLYGIYLKRGRYDEAENIAREVLSLGQQLDNIERGDWNYREGLTYIVRIQDGMKPKLKNDLYQQAAYRFQRAVRYNPNHGDAYYRLADAYAHIQYDTDADIDGMKYFLVVDMCQKALNAYDSNAGDPTLLKKYNTVSKERINGFMTSAKRSCPDETGAIHGLGLHIGERYDYNNKGVWKGQSVILRSY